MIIGADQVDTALARAEPRTACRLNGLPLLAERAHGELPTWGCVGQAVTLERVVPLVGDPGVLRCAFRFESCQVSRPVLLARSEAD